MYGTLSRYYIAYTLYNRTIKTNQNTFRSIRKASKLQAIIQGLNVINTINKCQKYIFCINNISIV